MEFYARAKPVAYGLGVIVPTLMYSSMVHADSAYGVDTVLGNALNPSGIDTTLRKDPRGIGAFHEGPDRSPSGLLYQSPFVPPELVKSDLGWDYRGSVEAGVRGGDANNSAANFRQYEDPHNGFLLNNFNLSAEKDDEAKYLALFGGGVGYKDQYYGFAYGRWNDFKLKFFFDETPHVFTTTARPIWQGIDTNYLSLPPGLTLGNSSHDAIQAAVDGAATTTLGLVRKTAGLSFDKTLSDTWSWSASYTLEKREGTRPFGGGFFFNFAPTPANVGASMETVEPIDYKTHDVLARLKYADATQQFNLSGHVSIFRNNIDTLTWENPFNIDPAQANATNIQRGRVALYPDNEAYNVKAEYAQSFPSFYNSRFTASGALGRMHQNDTLIPPTVNTGFAGSGPQQFDLANWNTTEALSQKNADATIDTALVDLGYHLVPIDKLSLHAKARFYETRNHTAYTAFNPLTGQFGFPALDGALGTILPGENGFYTPGQTGSANWQYRSIPFAYKQYNYGLNGDYQLTTKTQLSGAFEREEFHRDFRERDWTWEDRWRIALNSRASEIATVWLSYQYGDRRGSAYNYDPYTQFFTASLPGYSNPDGEFPFTLADLRKYDLADRKQNLVNARLNMILHEDLNGFVSMQYNSNSYPASYGRVDHQDQTSFNVELNYQPTALVNAYVFYSYQYSKLMQANITDQMIPGSSPNAGGANYPLGNAWTVSSKDRNSVFGLGLQYDLTRFKIDIKYMFSDARSRISYQENSNGATTIPLTPDQIGTGFPDLTYRQHFAEADLIFPLRAKLASRFFYRYENTRIHDWHYDGLSNDLLQQQRLYLDPGPQNYHANVLGVFIQYQL